MGRRDESIIRSPWNPYVSSQTESSTLPIDRKRGDHWLIEVRGAVSGFYVTKGQSHAFRKGDRRFAKPRCGWSATREQRKDLRSSSLRDVVETWEKVRD